MDVIGVDQSLTLTGLSKVIDGDRSLGDFFRHVSVDRIRTEAGDGSLSGTRDRIRYIVGRTMRFAPSECLSVIEAPYIPRHNSGSVLERAWLFGFLVDQLLLRGPVVQVRTKTRAMYATGNGNATKAEVLAAMRASFPLMTIHDDNEADALALAAMGSRFLGTPIDGPINKKQQQAMTSTVWPSIEGEK